MEKERSGGEAEGEAGGHGWKMDCRRERREGENIPPVSSRWFLLKMWVAY